MRCFTACLATPVGPLTVCCNETAVTAIRFGDGAGCGDDAPPSLAAASADDAQPKVLAQAVRELQAYFAGELRCFTVPVAPAGTPFQQRVWDALQQIPYGETRSYRAIAEAIGAPRACRAVGLANHCNPIPILIPCHRVVGSDGSLTGYAGGLAVKTELLRLEEAEQSKKGLGQLF